MTRRGRLAVLAGFVLILTLGGWWQFLRRDAPPGQPQLLTLDAASLSALREDFNAAADSVRAIVIVAPT